MSDPDLLAGYRPDARERAVLDRLVPFYTFLRRISAATWMRDFGTPEEFRGVLTRLARTEIPV